MAEYVASNPQFVVNGFRHSGIPAALDGLESEEEEDSGEDSDKLSQDEDDSDDDFHVTMINSSSTLNFMAHFAYNNNIC